MFQAIMSCKTEMHNSSSSLEDAEHLSRVVLSKELFLLLISVKYIEQVTTIDQVLDGLKFYIYEKRLFDPKNPIMISLKDDKLATILGNKNFSIFDIRKLLNTAIYPVKKDSLEELPSISSLSSTSKRKLELELNEKPGSSHVKKLCLHSLKENTKLNTQPSISPMILHIPSSPQKYDSSDTAESIQGYETAFVTDNSQSDDELWFFDEQEVEMLDYEVEDFNTDASSTDTLSDITEIIAFTYKSDSDEDFWGDIDSSLSETESDAEISESDQWKCHHCGSLNKPPMRYCLRCWDQRNGWLPDRSVDKDRRLPRRKQKNNLDKVPSSQEKECISSDSLVPSKISRLYNIPTSVTSQESKEKFFTPDTLLSSNESKYSFSPISNTTPTYQNFTSETFSSLSQNSTSFSTSSYTNSTPDNQNFTSNNSSQNSTISSNLNSNSTKEQKLCILCYNKPANASI